MMIKLSVAYAATDGMLPENVEMEWADLPADQHGAVMLSLDKLLEAPSNRSRYFTAVADGAGRLP